MSIPIIVSEYLLVLRDFSILLPFFGPYYYFSSFSTAKAATFRCFWIWKLWRGGSLDGLGAKSCWRNGRSRSLFPRYVCWCWLFRMMLSCCTNICPFQICINIIYICVCVCLQEHDSLHCVGEEGQGLRYVCTEFRWLVSKLLAGREQDAADHIYSTLGKSSVAMEDPQLFVVLTGISIGYFL